MLPTGQLADEQNPFALERESSNNRWQAFYEDEEIRFDQTERGIPSQ